VGTCAILIVDDNAPNRSIMAQVLEDASYVVIEARDGAGARRAAEENRLDLVILDMILPGEDGLAIARSLKDRHPTLPIFAVSVNSTRLPLLPHPDFAAVLALPYDIDDLLALVERLCATAPTSASASLPVMGQ
jgi:two-component system, OmpR family, response regulator